MTRGRVLGILLVIWLLGLGFLLQPHDHPAPTILHGRPLEAPIVNLPTLGPLHP